VASQEWYSKRVSFWMRRYENFVGLTEVKAAQAKVVEAEKAFVAAQERRREAQGQISDVQEKVKEIHAELEKTYRGEDKYLQLITQEHAVLRRERQLMRDFQELEKLERDSFSLLSAAVRDSHEQERAQAEKTKYWSVLGSVIGTFLGVLGTTINNRLRMRELRDLVTRSSSGERLTEVADELGANLREHEVRLKELVDGIKLAVTDSKVSLAGVGEMRAVSTDLKGMADKLDVRKVEAATSEVAKRANDVARAVHEQTKTIKVSGLMLGKILKTCLESNGGFAARRRGRRAKARGFPARAGGAGGRRPEGLPGRGRRLPRRRFLSRVRRSRALRRPSGSRGRRGGVRGENGPARARGEKCVRRAMLEENRAYCVPSNRRRRSWRPRSLFSFQVLSLIRNIQAASNSRRDREAALIRDLDVSILDKIEDLMDEREGKARATALASTAAVLILVPLAAAAVSRWLL